MTCKYPINSRSYKFCFGCSDVDYCEDAFSPNIPMPEVQPSKNVIPSASEANKMTNHVINDDTQLEDIAKEIREAIDEGKFYISGDGSLQSETVKRLTELGYKVKTSFERNEPYWSISWKSE